ncbi:MAG: argininosuccinate lyase [Alphaproteobacteria bacterium]|jgi:argininosuccinate lyase|nr:argininosuccinate lyase [Alphaproteobacteria bacterium]
MTKDSKANPMWGGHFSKAPSQVMEDINASIAYDQKLYQQDIKGSIAHATMLASCKIITKQEAAEIITALEQIKEEISTGKFEFKAELEDIHMNIEARLKAIIGDVAGKLHTARSRNDQVATDFKLYVKQANSEVIILLKELISALIKLAEKNLETIMPGYTHLQAAQPVTFAHHLHAYVEMLARDLSRYEDANNRLNQSPLGAAALAGTSFPIDRHKTAKLLGFKEPTNNSLDSVSDRDFALDFLANTSIAISHLSRFAEEIIIWLSKAYDFIKLSDSFTTGSSIMPQKRNPDAAELVRGKTGRIYGNLMSLLTTMKALPLAYSKDMQEDKEPLFDSHNTIIIALKAMIGMVTDMEVKAENLLSATASGFITATDLADYLVRNFKVPFREAHHITGKLVKLAEQNKVDLADLELEDMQKIEPRIKEDIYSVLTVENSVKSRSSYGGTAPLQVEVALKEAKKKYV